LIDSATSSVLPAWITPELMASTRDVWGPKYDRALSDWEVIDILAQVGRLLDVLLDESATPASVSDK